MEYDVSELDRRAGTPGLHTVGTKVVPPTLLPPDLFARFADDAFWRHEDRMPDGLRIV